MPPAPMQNRDCSWSGSCRNIRNRALTEKPNKEKVAELIALYAPLLTEHQATGLISITIFYFGQERTCSSVHQFLKRHHIFVKDLNYVGYTMRNYPLSSFTRFTCRIPHPSTLSISLLTAPSGGLSYFGQYQGSQPEMRLEIATHKHWQALTWLNFLGWGIRLPQLLKSGNGYFV